MLPKYLNRWAISAALTVAISVPFSALSAALGAAPGEFTLKAELNRAGVHQELKNWNLADLHAVRQISCQEKDPGSQKVCLWKGVSLSALVDGAIKGLSAEEKAHIDLVILRNDKGDQALIPRAFLNKYSIMLATERDKKNLGSSGPLYSVAPWTSNSKIKQEGMFLEALFISSVSQIELTNYKERYSGLYLKRRTDPAAMKGEKLFVQNCLGCHATGPSPSGRALASSGHPAVKGMPTLEAKDIRPLASYLDAYRLENPSQSAAAPGNQPISAQK